MATGQSNSGAKAPIQGGTLTADTELTQEQRDNAVSVFGPNVGAAMHSFKGSKVEQYRMIAKACGPDVGKSKDCINKVIAVANYYCHKIEIVREEDGEVRDCIRCVLIEPDGKAWAFVSDGIAKEIARIIDVFGAGPYNPPVKVEVKQIQTRNNRSTLSLLPVD